MKIYKKGIFILLFFMVHIYPLANIMNIKESSVNQNDPVILVNRIRNKIIEKFRNKYELNPSAYYDSMFSGIVQEVGIGFNIYKNISKQLARQILIECVQDFVNEVNSDIELRAFLSEYPFSFKNIDVRLFIFTPDGLTTYFPNLAVASSNLGNLCYKTNDPNNKYNYKTEEEETFEEALKRSKEEMQTEESL